MRKLFITILSFCFFYNAYAQNVDLGSWNIVNLKYNFDDKWSAFGETQFRSLKFYNYFHYYEYKAGINYKAHKHVRLTLGAGSYQTYKEGGNFILPKNNDEFRLWPQVILFQSIRKLNIEQRYRAELRFTSNGYRNRFRYRFGVSYPFGKVKKDYETFLFSINNEIFFTNKEPYVERNRLLFTLNYKPSKATSIQIGYLQQFDYKINDEVGRDFLQLGCYVELFRKQSSNKSTDTESKDN